MKKMHIMKGTSGLGLRIIGGKGSNHGDIGIFVSQLEERGAAFKYAIISIILIVAMIIIIVQ